MKKKILLILILTFAAGCGIGIISLEFLDFPQNLIVAIPAGFLLGAFVSRTLELYRKLNA